MKEKNKIYLWLGNIYKDSEISSNLAISIAANNWQKKIIENYFFDKEHYLLSYMQQRVWPLGKLLPKIKKKYDNQLCIRYINFPFIKKFSIFLSAFFILKKFIKENNVDIAIAYNIDGNNIGLFKYLLNNNTRRLVIWADSYNVGPDFINFKKQIKFIDGHIFLSKYLHDIYQKNNKIFFEGLIDNEIKKNYKKLTLKTKFTIFYSGSLSKWTGIEKFINLFNKLDKERFEFRFSSPDPINLKMKNLLSDNIKFLGYLNCEELDLELKNSDFLLNNRDLSVDGNQNNFPSKLLNYFIYLKPILSVKLKSFDDKYKDILFFFDLDNFNSLENQIYKIINFSEQNKLDLNNKITNFILRFNNQNLSKFDNFIHSKLNL